MLHRLIAAAVVAAPLLALASLAQAQPARIEIQPIESMHLTNQTFLTGQRDGRSVMLAGELRIAKPGSDKLPAVILVHGSGGIGASTDRWANELNSIGVSAFILDSFAGRGIVSTVADQSQLDSIAMMVDAFKALAVLAEHPRVDAKRIAVMGFSKGAVAAVYSSTVRFARMHGPATATFAAHIGLYTPCNVEWRDDTKTSDAPIRLHHGLADDYVSIVPCRGYVERLKAAGADVVLSEYADAHHAYDNFTLGAPVANPRAQTTRNCLLKEGDGGRILNAKTNQPYSLSDACVERGPHVGYNAAAHQATVAAVKAFLTQRFDLKG
jgi:dienelactone hydrolase